MPQWASGHPKLTTHNQWVTGYHGSAGKKTTEIKRV